MIKKSTLHNYKNLYEYVFRPYDDGAIPIALIITSILDTTGPMVQ